jgi:hypothetical protein
MECYKLEVIQRGHKKHLQHAELYLGVKLNLNGTHLEKQNITKTKQVDVTSN